MKAQVTLDLYEFDTLRKRSERLSILEDSLSKINTKLITEKTYLSPNGTVMGGEQFYNLDLRSMNEILINIVKILDIK